MNEEIRKSLGFESYKRIVDAPGEIEQNPSHLKFFFDYWSVKPNLYDAKLSALKQEGLKEISTHIPWSKVENDIHHSLHKFLSVAKGLGLKIRIFVMPNPGLNYAYGGFPKEIVDDHTKIATDYTGLPILHLGAPHIYHLPSFNNVDVLKRFGAYLLKIQSILVEVYTNVDDFQKIEIAVDDGFFSYYRNYKTPLDQHGDFSASFLSAREAFTKNNPKKESGEFQIELLNRLISNTIRVFQSKLPKIKIVNFKGLSIEHMPENKESSLCTEIFDFEPPVSRWIRTIQEQNTFYQEKNLAIELSPFGLCRKLNAATVSFLVNTISAHKLELRMQPDSDFSSSRTYLAQSDEINKVLSDYMINQEIGFVVSSLITTKIPMAQKVKNAYPSEVLFIEKRNLQKVSANHELKCCIVDENLKLDEAEVLQLLQVAKRGATLVLEESHVGVTESERELGLRSETPSLYHQIKSQAKPLKINMGLMYEVFSIGQGNLIIYRKSDKILDIDQQPLNIFFNSIFRLSEINKAIKIENKSIFYKTYQSKLIEGEQAVCLINSSLSATEFKIKSSDAVSMLFHSHPLDIAFQENAKEKKSISIKMSSQSVMIIKLCKTLEDSLVWT